MFASTIEAQQLSDEIKAGRAEFEKAYHEAEAIENFRQEERDFDRGVEETVALLERRSAHHHPSQYKPPHSIRPRGARGAFRSRK